MNESDRPRLRPSPLLSALLLFLAIAVPCKAGSDPRRDTMHQLSTLGALMSGVYEGTMRVGELAKLGDIGLGTFDALDGEMVVLDGRIYQVKADGSVRVPEPSVTVPFASVTFFDPDRERAIGPGTSMQGALNELDSVLPTLNIFYAVRIEGSFKKVKTRSVPAQVKPYPPLAEITAMQPTFDFEKVEGVMVGWRCPEYSAGFNLPGWHLHFLTKDRKAGGHVLGFTTDAAVAEIDDTPELHVILPGDQSFYRADLKKHYSTTAEK